MYFTIEKIENQLKEIRQAIYRGICDLTSFKFLEGEWSEMEQWMFSGLECPEFDDSEWANFRLGEFWGGYDYLAWFRAWVQIPPTWRDKQLALNFLVGPRDGGGSTAETLLYINGKALQAVDVWHEEAWLPPEVVQQGQFHVALKSWSGVLNIPARRHFKQAQLVWIDEPTQDFYFLCDTVLKAVKVLDEMDLRRVKGIQLLNAAFLSIDFTNPGSSAFYASIDNANQYLQAGVAALQKIKEIKPKVIGIGHAHIDLAWLWRLRHSREKASRTFATALHLMRQYPEYHFLHSSPQLYQYLKEDYPQIFEQVKERIAAGQWEINGGMWVEADTNLASGEALIRQFLFGKRFVRAEFGVDMNILWLPDVFGYSAALPQIAKGCGIEYFLTSKISWSQFNRFPYDTFNWRGIDGTELLTYFVTTPENNSSIYTYNGQVQPAEVKGIWNQYQQKNENDELLMLYGWGDGGGGPTREMLESAQTLKNFPGLPEVELGRAANFFSRLGERLQGKSLPVWDGELYLEYHRGTYTSQAQNKRLNRKAEILFQQAEWLSAIADIITNQDCYPVQALNKGWELILLNQFHDILPGSSIRQVYEDSYQDYQKIFAIGEQAVMQAKQALAHQINPGKDRLIVFNSLPWRLDGLVEIPWTDDLEKKEIRDVNGNGLPVQIIQRGEGRKLLIEVPGIPSLGYQAYPVFEQEQEAALEGVGSMQTFLGDQQRRESEIGHKPWKTVAWELRNVKSTFQSSEKRILFQSPPLQPAPTRRQSKNDITVQPDLLENSFYCITLNQNGQISSLWDKQNQREVLASGQLGNVFQVFEDKPMNFDAWDIDIYYQEKMRTVDNLLEAVVEESGPLRGVLRLRWRIYDSTITQWLTVYQHSHRIDFRTQVDWHEHQVLLKVAFPVGVRSTRATYDIQFGNLERPTHQNTSWDMARFEMIGHKWADLSEGNYGVSLLNDCKYGYDVRDNVLRLTLIKSAIHPDPQADQGWHDFTYSLLTHRGEWRNSDLVQQAYELNNPLNATFVSARQGNGKSSINLPSSYQFAEIDCEDVLLETVKKAESGQAWIIRVYEYKQYHRNQVNILFGQPIRKAVACNMIEEDEHSVEYDGYRLSFPIAPYEVKTFKIWF